MKHYLLILVILFFWMQGCKTKQSAETSASTNVQNTGTPMTTGFVSHQYRAGGCATVVLVQNTQDTLTLIPREALPAELDKDGMKITFNYRLLRMHNPAGCNVGIPAELTNISKH